MSVLFLETKDLPMAGLVAASASLPALPSSFLPAPLPEDDPGVLFLFAHKEPLSQRDLPVQVKGLAGTRPHPPPRSRIPDDGLACRTPALPPSAGFT